VQLDDLGLSRELVKAVDVLSDEAEAPQGLGHLHQSDVARIGSNAE